MSKRTHNAIQAAPLRLANHRDPQRLVCVLFQVARELEKTFPENGNAEIFEDCAKPAQQVQRQRARRSGVMAVD